MQRNLKATEVAIKLGISLPYLSQIESDRAVPSEVLARQIARLYSQDEDEFVFHARRGINSLQTIMQQSPRSAVTYLSRVVAESTEKKQKGGKAMVRLIAESEEDLAPLRQVDDARATRTSGIRQFPEVPFTLSDTFDIVRPSVVAFASRLVQTPVGGKPLFPAIIGTGFVVDSDGIVVTNRHVIEALEKLPPHPISGVRSAIALVWSEPEAVGEGVALPILMVEIKGYSSITSFRTNGPFYGEDLPDLGFVQLKVRGIPALPLAAEPNTLRQGLEVATAGFPLGTDPLVAYGKVSQLTPLLRRGIVSSVLPFPAPQPHGFTMDIMSQGGASGSPVFLVNTPKVVGIVHAGFDNTNLTFAIPSALLRDALSACRNGASLDLSDVPTLESLVAQSPRSDELRWDSFMFEKPKV